MWWWHGGGWFAWTVMTVGMVAFWSLVAWLVVTLLRDSTAGAADVDPERRLADRFAAGDIDAEEYRTSLEVLRRGRPAAGRS